jgi:anhydro-N-acetylmuramic acid kinase
MLAQVYHHKLELKPKFENCHNKTKPKDRISKSFPMDYKIIGLMSGSSLDGLDIAYVHFTESAGKWSFEIRETACYPYSTQWITNLKTATSLNARDYLLLDAAYGHYTGELVNRFIETFQLEHQVQLISSHGHTSFHIPEMGMTAQLGNGAAIAAKTGIRVISDLRSLDLALGGQGAPIVPIGDLLLFSDYQLFLNIGGIANISYRGNDFKGFDVCPANRVLNMLASNTEKGYDEDGRLAASGTSDEKLLEILNAFEYYRLPFPKSLANEFGVEQLFPLIEQAGLSDADALRTYTEHICRQVSEAIGLLLAAEATQPSKEVLVTGGGASNVFLIERLQQALSSRGLRVVVPEKKIVDFKEALVVALMGALRWREDINVLSSVTGASRDHTGGAIWDV